MIGPPVSRAPWSLSLSVLGGPSAPHLARELVLDRLDGALDDQGREILELLVSELVTNCVVHARADAASRIDLAVSRPPGAVHVEVSTAGPGFTHRAAPRDFSKPGGRGLALVDALASSWGVAQGGANMVWFELAA